MVRRSARLLTVREKSTAWERDRLADSAGIAQRQCDRANALPHGGYPARV